MNFIIAIFVLYALSIYHAIAVPFSVTNPELRNRLLTFPRFHPGKVVAHYPKIKPDNVAGDFDDDIFDLTKRQQNSDDYGHGFRFGKRDEQFDDYGHMRFGRNGSEK